jgi:pimeloyl-ACP methyl ester carboxylesterase
MESSFVLHVRRSGRGTPVVLIHGVAGSGAIWHRVASELEKKFDVIRLDLLGYGYSPKPRLAYTVDEHVAAIRTTLERLALNEPVTIVGLSMGALVGLEYAAQYPANVSRAVCVGLPYYRSPDEARDNLQGSYWANLVLYRPWLAHILIIVIWGTLKRSRRLSGWFAPKNYTANIVQETMMSPYYAFSSTLKECLVGFRLEPLLAKLNLPILFIHGSTDRWTKLNVVKKLAVQLPRAKLTVVDGQVHNLVLFAPAIVSQVIAGFVKVKK